MNGVPEKVKRKPGRFDWDGPIYRRRLYFLFVILFTIAIFLVVFASADSIGNLIENIFAPLNEWFRLSLRFLLGIVTVCAIMRLTPIRVGQLRSMHLFPPTWLAIAIGYLFVCLFALVGWFKESAYRPEWWEWPLYGLVGLVLVSILNWALKTRPEPEESGDCKQVKLKTWEEMRKWLESEMASEDDLLNRLAIAKRFARHLLLEFGKDRTLGLIGPYGSGKSSVIRWLRKIVKTPMGGVDKVWVCEVSCWGFDDSASAIQHILSEAVKELSKHADCFSVRNLPDAYRKALSAGGSWWPSIADMFLGQPDPTEALRGFSPMLEALNARLVIVLEDLDRNLGRNFDPREVLATLQRLRKVRGIAFVVTGGAPQGGDIDFAKICDHIESLPPLKSDIVIEMIKLLRNHCLSMVAIDPRKPAERKEDILWGFHRFREGMYATMGIDHAPMPTAVMNLLATPRALKHALRHTWDIWGRLVGEIDFDDLLVANILRYGAPEAFNFLLLHMDQLRAELSKIHHDRDKLRRKERQASFREKWKQAVKDSDWDSKMALALIRFLIPNSETVMEDTDNQSSEACPQGVRHSAPTDYLRRLQAEEIEEDGVRDQDVLRAIEDWNKEKSTRVVEALCKNPKFGDAWEHFADRIKDDTMLELAERCLKCSFDANGARTSEDSPGMESLRKRLSQYPPPESKKWLMDRIHEAFASSLAMACELFQGWINPRYSFIEMKDVPDIRNSFIKAARDTYTESNPEALLRAIHVTHPYVVRWMVLPCGNDWSQSINDVQQWSWLGGVLLRCAERDFDKMIVQIVHLVTENGRNSDHELIYRLNTGLIDLVFSGRQNELYELLAQKTPWKLQVEYFNLQPTISKEAQGRIIVAPHSAP